ncbi:Redoxin [Ephemerocybe angulata]|uniref:Redoxin n=1 Tax=Ephemerocybe angulata TaxID=980116 RepID=A0A8H6HDH9_9AGAR|nr:Redoxin [Tulosesus angulatus]
MAPEASLAKAKAQIAPGATIPTVSVKELDPGASTQLTLTGKNIIIGVPGAFTTPCNAHIPGYVDLYDQFKAKGVSEIYVVAVNDAFVTKAWKEKLAPNGTGVRFIADDQGELIAELGFLFDAAGLLGGPRSKRFAIITDGDKVASLAVEDAPPSVTVTAAEELLKQV